jgi:hypothetical protein
MPGLSIANVFLTAQTFQAMSDVPSITARRYGVGQSSYIIQLQTEANGFLGGFDALGNYIGGTDAFFEFDEHASAAGTATSGKVRLYAKSDGLLYSKDDAGTETLVSGGSGGSGSVATDSIWDAAGDLVVGTGANAAARLPMGTALQVLRVNAGGTAHEYATLSAGGNALTTDPLSQFAATTSAQLRGVISDEVGTGALYFVGGDLGTPSALVGTNISGTASNLTAGDVNPAGTAIAAALGDKLDAANGTATGIFTLADGMARTPYAGTVTEASPDTISLDLAAGRGMFEINEATTLSFASTPTTGVYAPVDFYNSHTAAVVLTIPSSYSQNAGANITSFIVPAGGTVTVTWERLASSYAIYGDPLPLTGFTGTRSSPDTTGGAVTISNTINGRVIFANTTTEYDLEAAASWAGKVLLVHNCGTNTITIDPNASEVIYLAGAALSGGDRITISNTAGSYVALQSDGTSITVWGYSGTIADGN